jgi:site-specific recombinase XerD
MQDLEKKIEDKDGKEKSKNSPATRARKVACLKSYFNYLQNKAKLITYNPAYELETPKIPDKEIA